MIKYLMIAVGRSNGLGPALCEDRSNCLHLACDASLNIIHTEGVIQGGDKDNHENTSLLAGFLLEIPRSNK